MQLLGTLFPRFLFSGSEWGPRMCISNEFLGDAIASGLGTTHL